MEPELRIGRRPAEPEGQERTTTVSVNVKGVGAPVEMIRNLVGRLIWSRPQGSSCVPEYVELLDVYEEVRVGDPPGAWYNKRAVIDWHGQPRIANLPQCCTFALDSLPEHLHDQIREYHDRGYTWLEIDGTGDPFGSYGDQYALF